MNKIQFNAIMTICTVILYAEKPTLQMLIITLIVAGFFAISYFSQSKELK